VQIDRSQIEAALRRKGFVEDRQSKHRYFYHEHKGKRTGAYAYTSHGSKFKVYGVELLNRMKRELRLDSLGQVGDLCLCPMSADDYNDVLRNKGVISR
jgi:hypothetical protein